MKFEVCGFHHLHLHSEFSLLDGYGKVDAYAKKAPEIGMEYLTISDHGVMGAIPAQITHCEKNKIKPIFAIELYVNPLQKPFNSDVERKAYRDSLSPEDLKIYNKSFHLLAIAFNQVGYRNLVKLSSWGWLYGRGGRPPRPRVNHEQLIKHKEGIIFTSCCYISEIGQAFDRGGEEEAFPMVEKYMAMFGENFYLEIMLLDFKKQKPYDIFLLKAAEKYGLRLEISCDTHYPNQEDSHYQRLMLMQQTGRTLKEINEAIAENREEDFFELQDANLWMKSEKELDEKWLKDYSDVIDYEIYKEAKRNTLRICEKARGVELDRTLKLPQIKDADEILKDEMIKGFKRRNLPKNQEYLNRLKEEYDLFKRKGFCSYFLIQKMAVDAAKVYCAKRNGTDGSEAISPGRGSFVSSLVAYCLGLHDVNPIQHDLLFSRFLSENRGGKSMKTRFTIEPISV